jgi:hypothetical protein
VRRLATPPDRQVTGCVAFVAFIDQLTTRRHGLFS